MSPEGDAGRRPSGLSRRRLLAGIGGVGAVGAASGLGTGAYLSDRETVSGNAFGAGAVGLTVDGDPTDGTVTVGPLAVDRTTFDGRPEPERFEVGASANPVRVWLATRCPDGDPLGDALEVEVAVDGESLTGGYRPLAAVERDLATGRRIDVGCLDPDGGPIVVEVAAYLPADSPDVGGVTTDLTFRLYAEQCRHVTEAEANAPGANPFAADGCGESEDDCPECVKFGKADFSGSTASGDVLPLEMFLEGAEAHEIEITGVETKDGGEVVGVAFRLQDADGNSGPDMCSVAVKGGPNQDVELADIDPASPETGKIVFAPRKPGEDKRYGVSNVTISICSDAVETDGGCAVCDDEAVSLASLDIRYGGDGEPSVAVVSTKGGTGGTLFEGTVANGDVFTLDGSDVTRSGNHGNGNGGGQTDRLGPEIEIAVDGGATTPIHVSCSELLAVGMRFGPDGEFEIAGGTTTDGRPICGSEAN